MRKLARTLGFEAMSLYNYVANKDDVIDGILDLVLAETELPSTEAPWDEAIRSSAISVHAALRRHPWACTLLISSAHIRPGRLHYMDALLGRLRQAGFDADATYHAYHVLDGHISGFTLWESSHSISPAETADLVERFEEFVPRDIYPELNEHARQHFAEGPHHDVSAFEFGLDLILDGLRTIRAAR
jgi:AcrR family transcriptional regulator